MNIHDENNCLGDALTLLLICCYGPGMSSLTIWSQKYRIMNYQLFITETPHEKCSISKVAVTAVWDPHFHWFSLSLFRKNTFGELFVISIDYNDNPDKLCLLGDIKRATLNRNVNGAVVASGLRQLSNPGGNKIIFLCEGANTKK